jgi:hypothetical protein
LQNGVRIPHPKIEELALQAQGVGIFVIDECPSSKSKHYFAKGTFFFMANQDALLYETLVKGVQLYTNDS